MGVQNLKVEIFGHSAQLSSHPNAKELLGVLWRIGQGILENGGTVGITSRERREVNIGLKDGPTIEKDVHVYIAYSTERCPEEVRGLLDSLYSGKEPDGWTKEDAEIWRITIKQYKDEGRRGFTPWLQSLASGYTRIANLPIIDRILNRWWGKKVVYKVKASKYTKEGKEIIVVEVSTEYNGKAKHAPYNPATKYMTVGTRVDAKPRQGQNRYPQ